MVKHRGAHIFNPQCLQEKVIPSGGKINFKSSNFAESNIIRRAELALVGNIIRQCNKRTPKHREEIKEHKRKRKNSINNESFLHCIISFIFNSKEKTSKLPK